MSEAYKGLRRRRKRTHPSKCPCCTTDQEGEPENEGNAGSENHNEVIKDVRQSKRKRTPKKKEDESKSDSESSELNSTATPSEKPPPKKRKLRNVREESPSQDILPNKDSTKKATKAVSLKNKDKNSKEIKVEKTVEKSKAKKTSNNKNGNSTNVKKDSKSTKKISKTQLHDSNEEYVSDVEEVVLISKVARRKSSSSNDNDIKKKKTDNNGKIKGSSKSKTNASTKKDSDVDVLTSQESDNQILRTAKKVKKSVTKNVAKGKTASRRMPIEKPLAVTKTSQNKSKSVAPSFITQTKIMAFDNLYDKLRSSYGNKNLRIEEAAEMLVKISCECLHMALKSSLKTDNREENLQIFSRNRGNITQHEGKGISDTEEIVSQAAEALVSFRSKSPLTREDSKTEKPASSSQGLHGTASASQNTWQTGEKAKLHTNTAAFTSSQAVQALMQIQTPCSFPSQVFPTTPVTASLAQNILHGIHSMPQSYPQLLPSTITTSFTNLMPMVNSHGTLPSFSQIASHLRPPPVMTGGVQPALLNAGLPNPNMPTASAMLTNQALLQPQLQQPMPNPVTSNKPTLTTLTTMKPAVQPVEPTGSKANTQAQNPLQQPLKGMEEVIGNVGSNIPPPYVLNIKSPVVFLGSPQNLGGVPRNLMANPCNQATINSEQSGYPPVAPRPVSKSDALRMNPGNVSSVPNVLTMGGRPILPRTQVQCGDDSKLRMQSIAPQPGMPQVAQHSGLSSSSPYPGTASTLAVQPALTQVTSTNIKKTTLVTVNIPSSSSQMSPLPNFIHQNIQENPAAEGLSPSSVAAKQAVKKLVHERTKSAELKREASGLANPTSKLKAILPLPPKEPSILPSTASVIANRDSGSKNNEFNIEQAATALLSIGVPDGIESIGLKHSTSVLSKEDHDEDVVFTSKGTFRVGDVDVDPRYNRIGREGYTCGKCNKIFTSLSYLARHIKRVCPDMSCRKWKCTLCDKAFRHPFGLQQHVYTHTGERPHKCPLCPKAFYSSNDLRRHSRIHSGERPYRCKHCDKSFATTISLKTHTYIHTGEKPHKCPQCPKTFATSSKLGRHIVTHSEQRPFSCDQCPKSFNRSGDLRRHNLAVHDGKEKSFDCDLCPATFSKPAGLRRHNTTLHQRPPKTMECEDCGTQFSTPICLKMHRDTYHKNPSTTTTAEADKIFTCDMCGKTYSSAALLTKHKVTHEPSSTAGYNPSQFQHIAPKPVEQSTVESGS